MKVLLLNAGSSSLKATLAESEDGTTLASGTADWAGSATRYKYTYGAAKTVSETVDWKSHAEAVNRFMFDLIRREPVVLADRSELDGVGHRVVHGGPFASPVRITPEVRERIAALAELAPLHNPPSLEALSAAEAMLPEIPQVAVFDTAFHATMPPEAFTYAVPASWTRDWGIRRFGFHGLSHAYCSRRAAEMLDRPPDQLRLIICHLGHGCSATAVHGGQSIDTTMGFTPLEGLMMGTRSGSIDPGIMLHLLQQHRLTPEQIETALNAQAGLLGVSELSADMRQVLAAAHDGHEPSRLAVAIYSRRVRQAIGALAVTLDGLDALVFTAGVGEHAVEIREAICTGLECVGVELDREVNRICTPDADVAQPTSPARILVMTTREDIVMLQDVVSVLQQDSTHS